MRNTTIYLFSVAVLVCTSTCLGSVVFDVTSVQGLDTRNGRRNEQRYWLDNLADVHLVAPNLDKRKLLGLRQPGAAQSAAGDFRRASRR